MGATTLKYKIRLLGLRTKKRFSLSFQQKIINFVGMNDGVLRNAYKRRINEIPMRNYY